MRNIRNGIEIYDILDLFPELRVEGKCDLRKVYISLGELNDGKYKAVIAPSPYYAARTPHNVVRLIVSGGINDELLETMLKHIDADMIKRTKMSVCFSIYGLRTDLPFWY